MGGIVQCDIVVCSPDTVRVIEFLRRVRTELARFGKGNAYIRNNNQPGNGNEERNWPKVRVCNVCAAYMQYLQFETYWILGPM